MDKLNTVKENYFEKDNTFFTVAKTDPKDLVEKEIGDSKQIAEFIPQQKVCRWENECNVSLRLVHDEVTPVVSQVGDKVEWKGDKVEAHFYDIVGEEHTEGASEFEIILKEKPKTNVVEFTVVDKDVEYTYQPEITDEEVLDSVKEKLTQEEILAKKREMRPENVVGSYAVYAKTQKNNYTGCIEYKTGKIGHFYRPQIEDSAGTKVWGELHIENGLLSVTIPQDFLDKAVYPVKHSAGLTFGYTSAGASNMTLYHNKSYFDTSYIVGGDYTLSEAGDVSSISIYVGALPASYSKLEVFGGIWTKGAVNTSYRSARTGEHIHTDSFTTTGWKEMSYSTQPSLSADDYKLIAFGGADGAGNYQSMTGKYDTTGASNGITPYNTGYPAGSIPATGWEYLSDVNVFEVGDYPVRAVADRKVSIYATYTAAASYNPAFAHRRLLL